MRFWWVNHKQTFEHEVGRGYIWCPKRKKGNLRNHFYETAREVQEGDLIFSYAHAKLQAVGVAKGPCYSCPRPDEFGKVGLVWDLMGWRVDVGFVRFTHPLRIMSVADQVAGLLPVRYSPIREDGQGNQGAYLAKIEMTLARRLLELAEPGLLSLLNPTGIKEVDGTQTSDPVVLIEWEDLIQKRISTDLSMSETTRKALIHARVGQGKFKQNVLRFERECRLTHVQNPQHLVASHIKPWRESNDEERLNAGNGLLLTPSIDHLFDRGFISFGDHGEVLVSPVADTESLRKMGVDGDKPIFTGRFNSDQQHFLDHHRKEIFLKSEI
jgi:putative restriction endonuclease